MSLADDIVAHIDEGFDAEPERDSRGYIGASGVGNKCDAFLAYMLRGFPDDPIKPHLKRIFRDGHRIENQVVADLRKGGYSVLAVDDETGRQFRYELAGGHIVCHADGQIALKRWELEDLALLEIKSMNDSLWNQFVKHGVKSSHPKYWDQMQMMMGMSGVQRCFFIAYNKNTSKYHGQLVDFDPFEWSYIETRLETVFAGEARKISDDPESFLCRFCGKQEVCWRSRPVKVECKTCAFATPTLDGKWWCRKNDAVAETACSEWKQYTPKDKK